ISKDVLIRFDNEKGPFEWNFHSLPAAPIALTPPATPTVPFRYPRTTRLLAPYIPNNAVARKASPIPSEQLLSWTIRQRRKGLLVWQEIDGKKTVRDIKMVLALSLPEVAVDEVLQVLLKLDLIAISV